MIDYKSIDICNVTIPLVEGTKGMMFGGGADSSLLLYILMKNCPNDNFVLFTQAENTRSHVDGIVSSRVIKKIIDLTGCTNVTNIVEYLPDKKNPTTMLSSPLYYYKNKKIDVVYFGITQNPPKDIADSFLGPERNTQADERDPTAPSRPIINFYQDTLFCQPWVNENKKKIAEIYDYLNLMEELFPLTLSCTNSDKNYDPLIHCDNCWWCKERKWGFGKL